MSQTSNPKSQRLTVVMLFIILVTTSCVTSEKGPPSLSLAEITKIVPTHVPDREGWARDVAAAIEAVRLEPTAERVCAVLAVIEQESNFQTNPRVRNLPQIVRDGLKQKLSKLGPLAGPALFVMLQGNAPGQKESFSLRIGRLQTERDLDLFFRDMANAYRGKFPGSFLIASALLKIFGDTGLDDLNPVTTAGSMQVKVSFARTLPGFDHLNDEEVRDLLYSRAGGVRAGAARLLGYKASYDNIIYRFADYNSGVYSSRNAAFQKLLSDLTGKELVLDGDLLSYDKQGDSLEDESNSLKAMIAFAKAHDMWIWRVRRAARQEKEADFEETAIWEEVREAWKKANGKDPVYARIPNVNLTSPKLSGLRTTQWFALSVEKRYKKLRLALSSVK